MSLIILFTLLNSLSNTLSGITYILHIFCKFSIIYRPIRYCHFFLENSYLDNCLNIMPGISEKKKFISAKNQEIFMDNKLLKDMRIKMYFSDLEYNRSSI